MHVLLIVLMAWAALIVANDITDRKVLQQQLQHSQRMEAVGRLAGGIAHDFSNVLTVISGACERLQDDITQGSAKAGQVDVILRHCARATALTRQLLAFSRQQTIAPRIVDLGELVGRASELIAQLIGSNITVDVDLDPDMRPVEVDPVQMEQVLMNLAINARDAMPRGGRLTVRTARAFLDEAFVRLHPGSRPGAYALLEVADEGVGMDAATLARIFDPFYPTKEVGRGTGLGLSTVYGIVKQSDGYVAVDSTPGVGSVFRVFLPAAAGSVVAASPPPPDPVAPGSGGSETILLIEDEEALRTIAREILEEAGYRVLEARDVREGVALAAGPTGSIHAVLSDVVMPGGSGPQGVALIRALHPRIRALFMSGYPDLDPQRHGTLAPGDVLLEKPFTAESLLRRIRQVLD